MKNLNGIFSGVGGGLMKVGSQLTNGLTRPILGIGKQIVNTGMEFEVAMKRMQGISRASGEDYKMLEKKARELGASTSKTAKDAADSFSYMARWVSSIVIWF